MGAVYRARDTRLDRVVAIKVLLPQADGNQSATARLTREARAVASISHPNVLGIFDVGEHQGRPFVVTELLEGATLREEMRAGALPLATAVGFALQIAHGLGAAHDQGVVHRDLKPENLFVTRDRRVKILDFGLARVVAHASVANDETGLNDATNPGPVMGTAGYMSPEQARGLAVDHRSDIFAFGAILFEMLSGQRAFSGPTVADTMASIVRDEPQDLQRINNVVPAALARVVVRCLTKDVHARVQSIRELPLVLDAISGARVTAPAAEPPPSETAVVVLPFENMSPDPDNAYFADGLTEEIISDLAKVRDLRVISRTTAMQLKGRKTDLPSLARELRVDLGAVVAADPNDAFAWVIKAFGCGMLDRMPEARDALARAERVDPLEPLVIVGRINIPMMSGDFDEAVRAGARAYARASDHPVLAAYYIQALAAAGHVREAGDVAEAILRVKPAEAWSGFAQLIPWGLRGDGAAIAAAMTPEWIQWARGDAQNGHIVAQAFALAGRSDDAFVWLDHMMAAGGVPYPFISSLDPLLSSLHTDPRWPAFLERLKAEWERVE